MGQEILPAVLILSRFQETNYNVAETSRSYLRAYKNRVQMRLDASSRSHKRTTEQDETTGPSGRQVEET